MATESANHVMAQVRAFRLREYDWNGTGGLPMRGDSADTLADVFALDCIADLPSPEVTLGNDGAISVEYDESDDSDRGKKLFLVFPCGGVVTYMRVFEDGVTTIEGVLRMDKYAKTTGEFCPDEARRLADLCRWFAGDEQ